MRKGDRVEFDTKNGKKYGTVLRGGSKKVTVIADGELDKTYSGPAGGAIRPSTQPLPKDELNPMDRYSLRKYKEIDGHGDSRTFSAEILKNGRPIIHVSNNGWGGCNEYYPINGADRRVLDIHLADAQAWAKQFGYEGMSEPDDMWVEWYQHERPYGVLAKDMITNFKKELEGFSKGR